VGAGWAAGVIRARALAARRTGRSAARELASSATLGDALRFLAATPYRRNVDAGSSLAEAQRAVAATLLWHLRVLAGWLPSGGADLLRPLAAGFEIANVGARLRSLAESRARPVTDEPPEPRPYLLGALDTAWHRLERAGTPHELRRTLASSLWGDPGADTPSAVAVAMRMAAAVRTARTVRPARRWAEGRVALLTARELFVGGRGLPEPARRLAAELLGARAVEASAFSDFQRLLPSASRWAVDGIDDARDLWRAEARWWAVLEEDGISMMRRLRYQPVSVVGAVAVLSVDAWRVRAALELAARGGGPLEVLDAAL
jgi:hypothetical protein